MRSLDSVYIKLLNSKDNIKQRETNELIKIINTQDLKRNNIHTQHIAIFDTKRYLVCKIKTNTHLKRVYLS